jgi:hypothetical protein
MTTAIGPSDNSFVGAGQPTQTLSKEEFPGWLDKIRSKLDKQTVGKTVLGVAVLAGLLYALWAWCKSGAASRMIASAKAALFGAEDMDPNVQAGITLIARFFGPAAVETNIAKLRSVLLADESKLQTHIDFSRKWEVRE